MITPELKAKLAKVYELVKRGTDGEQAAAKKALDKMIAKYNLDGIDLESIDKSEYYFKYSSNMDIWMLHRVVLTLIDKSAWQSSCRYYGSIKEVKITLTYLDYVTVEAAYNYFKKHMNKQWKSFCLPNLKRCKTAKSRAKRREELKGIFLTNYGIASNLFAPHELQPVKWEDLSEKEKRDRIKLDNIEGGKYNRQATNGLLIEI